jgi:hypothetical protein
MFLDEFDNLCIDIYFRTSVTLLDSIQMKSVKVWYVDWISDAYSFKLARGSAFCCEEFPPIVIIGANLGEVGTPDSLIHCTARR